MPAGRLCIVNSLLRHCDLAIVHLFLYLAAVFCPSLLEEASWSRLLMVVWSILSGWRCVGVARTRRYDRRPEPVEVREACSASIGSIGFRSLRIYLRILEACVFAKSADVRQHLLAVLTRQSSSLIASALSMVVSRLRSLACTVHGRNC
jgi:hypothetical protein